MDSSEGAEALFQHAAEGIIIVNKAGVIVRINPSAAQLFGYAPTALIGQRIEQLVPTRFASTHHQKHNHYIADPKPRKMGAGRDLYALRKDGTEFPVEISLSPYAREKENFVIAFVVDITLRKQAEDRLRDYSIDLERQVHNRTLILEEAIEELQKTKDQLYQALEKERELNELKSRFVSMASHEFRTPLATMLSSLSLVTKYGEQNDKEKQSKHVARIKNSINHLTDMLNDLLSVSRLEEGKIDCQPQQLELQEFIGEVITEMQALAQHADQLTFTYSGDRQVLIDKRLLKHVLFNLLSNAIKYSPQGQPVVIDVAVAPNQLTIRIIDHGLGIPEEDQKHLFSRFFRSHNVTHIPGTGLGLSIVFRHVELMGGTLDFTSTENKGTTFTLTFPR